VARPEYFSEERFVLNVTAVALQPEPQAYAPGSSNSPPAA
jgi:hypothetical protein